MGSIVYVLTPLSFTGDNAMWWENWWDGIIVTRFSQRYQSHDGN